MDTRLLGDKGATARSINSQALASSSKQTPLLKKVNMGSSHYTALNSGSNLEYPNQLLDQESGIPVDNYGIVYMIFFLTGVAMLLPWNVFITADAFFALKFKGSKYETTFQNFFSAISSTTNLVVLVYALATQKKKNMYNRCLRWLVVMVLMFVVLTLYSQNRSFGPELNFWIAVVLLFIGAVSCSFLSSDVLALAATMNPIYVQGGIAGQALAGLLVSVAQLIVSFTGDQQEKKNKGLGIAPTPHNDAIIEQALIYFTSAFFITLFSTISFYYLQRHPLFSYTCIELDASDEDDAGKTLQETLLEQWRIVKNLVCEQLDLVFYLFLAFTITLALFPSLTASVRSVNSSGFVAKYFTQLSFVAYNVGDLIGRYLPTISGLLIESPRGIGMLSFGRLSLIPVFLMSYLDLGAGVEPAFPAFLASDFMFFLAMAVLSITNGYLGSVLMMSAPARTRDVSHRGTMASVMSLTLTIGLTSGSILSFPIRAIACGCNPF
ncbi:hypothetical protein DSO57_1034948 [Entomophthora muscae]|uniref:Uncharacterized protein n=2 Tax=Entomophthora muscae TaxID=34485 RepID=A0ACC2REI7_9FUNG|nr:hypothetical protein DSO57_1034948 [Entomophthora muscae]